MLQKFVFLCKQKAKRAHQKKQARSQKDPCSRIERQRVGFHHINNKKAGNDFSKILGGKHDGKPLDIFVFTENFYQKIKPDGKSDPDTHGKNQVASKKDRQDDGRIPGAKKEETEKQR